MAQRCSCEITLALLERLGGPHARRMRAEGNTQVGKWGTHDWLAHIAEEERLFFPMLPPKVAAVLLRDHAEIRKQLAQPRGRVGNGLAVAHAKLEDEWAEYLAKQRGWNLHDHGRRK